MATLYLIEQNTILRKSGDRMLLCKKPPERQRSPGLRESDIIAEWPCADIDHVMIFGNIQLTTQAMRHLLEHGIETAFLSRSGHLYGQLTPPCGKNVFLRVKQIEKFNNDKFRQGFSKKLVYAKVKNACTLLNAYHKNHPESFDVNELSVLEGVINKVHGCNDNATLLGIEGSAAVLYFKILSTILPEKWRFNGRSRRPPLDPANSVLSFGYTVLANELASLLDGIGLDPAVGFYHELDYGRPSLALDILEMFRHPLIDRLMLNLFNLNILNETDFTEMPRGGIYLSESGKRQFFIHYERMMGEYTVDYFDQSTEKEYRKIFRDYMYRLEKTISENTDFEPYIF